MASTPSPTPCRKVKISTCQRCPLAWSSIVFKFALNASGDPSLNNPEQKMHGESIVFSFIIFRQDSTIRRKKVNIIDTTVCYNQRERMNLTSKPYETSPWTQFVKRLKAKSSTISCNLAIKVKQFSFHAQN